MLTARDVSFEIAGRRLVDSVSVSVAPGEVLAVIGPNGAGKSTLLKTLAAQLPLMAGDRLLGDESYRDHEAHSAARAGISLVPQTGAVFPDLSVIENLRLGALHREDGPEAIAGAVERFPVLGERTNQSAGSLSGGERQLLAISCALLMRPSVLLLDEPTTGLAPIAARATADLIVDAVESGTSVAWVVEQMPELALERARHAYFLEAGQVRFEGTASQLLERDRLEGLMLQQA